MFSKIAIPILFEADATEITNLEAEKAVIHFTYKEEKEKTIKLYNTLLNSLSHELRTPISTIIGAVDTLKENKS